MSKPRCVKTIVRLSNNSEVPIYAGVRVRDALSDVTENMDVYQWGKLTLVLAAMYHQGKKDGKRELRQSVEKLVEKIPLFLNPGQPRKKSRK
jgi:hypothetical protein